MAAILLIFLLRDWAIPRKLKNHFPEVEFQQNLAQSSRSSIETHNWKKQNFNEIFAPEGFYRQHIILPRIKIIVLIYDN